MMPKNEELAILENIMSVSEITKDELITRIKKETTLCDTFCCTENCYSCVGKYIEWHHKNWLNANPQLTRKPVLINTDLTPVPEEFRIKYLGKYYDAKDQTN